MEIDSIKSVYFIGAGGIGMSALVRYFLSEPFCLFVVESCTRLAYVAKVEKLCKLLYCEQISVKTWVPSKQSKEVDDSLWQVAALTVSARHFICLWIHPT